MSIETGAKNPSLFPKPGWGESIAISLTTGIPAALPFLPVVAAILALKALFGRQLSDETFTAISHARTWVESGRAVASLLNPVCATDSPFWLMALAGWAKLGSVPNLERIAFQWAAWGDLLALIGVYTLARALGAMRVVAWFAVAAVGCSTILISASATGSNASWFTAIILWALFAHLRRLPWAWRAFPLFLLPLMRWDAALLPVLLVGHTLFRRESPRLVALLFSAALLGQMGYFAFYLSAYGQPWPHALIASLAIHSAFSLRAGLTLLAEIWTLGPQLGNAWLTALVALGLQCLAVLGYFLAGRGQSTRDSEEKKSNWPWLFLAAILSLLPAILLAPSAPWQTQNRSALLLPVLALVWVGTAAGLHAWIHSFDKGQEGESHSPWRAWLGFLPMTIAALAMTGALWQDMPGQFKRHYEQHQGRFAKASTWIDDMIRRVELHRSEAGNPAVTPLLPSPFTVLAEEPGVYLYRSRARILDRFGALSPEALPVLRAHPESLSGWQALRETFHPEVVSALRPMAVDSAEKQRFAGYRGGYVAGAPGAKDLLWLGLRPDLPVQAQP